MRQLTIRCARDVAGAQIYGHVFAFTEDGKVVADLQDPSGAYPETTAVTETADRLYIQSLHAKGWLDAQMINLVLSGKNTTILRFNYHRRIG